MKDLFRYVLMEFGDMCVDIIIYQQLHLIMQEWFVASLDTLNHVSYILHTIKHLHGKLHPPTVYSASYSLFNGGSGSQQPIIYGRMSCNGSEQTLSSCSKDVNYNSYCQYYKLGVICEGE